jgi:hypothetical protein
VEEGGEEPGETDAEVDETEVKPCGRAEARREDVMVPVTGESWSSCMPTVYPRG